MGTTFLSHCLSGMLPSNDRPAFSFASCCDTASPHCLKSVDKSPPFLYRQQSPYCQRLRSSAHLLAHSSSACYARLCTVFQPDLRKLSLTAERPVFGEVRPSCHEPPFGFSVFQRSSPTACCCAFREATDVHIGLGREQCRCQPDVRTGMVNHVVPPQQKEYLQRCSSLWTLFDDSTRQRTCSSCRRTHSRFRGH